MMVRDQVTAYVALGANLGQAVLTLTRAVAALASLPGTSVLSRSSLYCTAPIDSSGPDYTNAVVKISTALGAPDLLIQLQKIEQAEGRERPWHHAPRTLDLDVLLYGTATVDSPALTVPHPRMTNRAFVLVPLAEIAPEWTAAATLPDIQQQQVEWFTDSSWDCITPTRDPGRI